MLSDTICYIPKSEKTEKVVIMLHGYGSDGNDLISMAPFMGAHLPNTAFYAPDAPEKMNFMSGFKWFDIETEASVSVFSHSDYIERLMERAKNILPIVHYKYLLFMTRVNNFSSIIKSTILTFCLF